MYAILLDHSFMSFCVLTWTEKRGSWGWSLSQERMECAIDSDGTVNSRSGWSMMQPYTQKIVEICA